MDRTQIEVDALRTRIMHRSKPGIAAEFLSRLSISVVNEVIDLDFYGDPFGDSYADLLDTVSKHNIALVLRSLWLRGPDKGSNGTKNWNIEPMFGKNAIFPRLESFSIDLSQPGDNNRTIVASIYDEDGIIAHLLRQAPQLRNLTVPSAPNVDFFTSGSSSLGFLSVDAGLTTQGFIANLT